MAHGTCSVDDCEQPAHSRGWCKPHYDRWYKYGRLTPMTQEDRFWSHVDKTDGCWLWTASKSKGGYGKTMRLHPDGSVYAHRVAYELLVGLVPKNMHLDHLCRVRHCVNPAHLEPVTPGENARRGETGKRNRIKTHCPQGHPYDEANTKITSKGTRECRTCRGLWDGPHRKR